ncbi:MAG: hypothetical protein L3J43_06280, partial [Sulfurovum sp.]|nr:hypothetical protein [Sulfurovum sp.]
MYKRMYYKKIIVSILFIISMHHSSCAVPIKIMPLGDSITEGVAQIPDNPDQNSSNYNGTVTATADRI